MTHGRARDGTVAAPDSVRRARCGTARSRNGARLFVLENRFNPTLAISGSLYGRPRSTRRPTGG